MRVSIIDNDYSSRMYSEENNGIREGVVNRAIENLEKCGFDVKCVEIVNYENRELERVIITYE